MRSLRMETIAFALVFTVLAPSQGAAQSYLIDQSNTIYPDGSWNIVFYAPIGQEFVPDLPWLDVVEFWTRDPDGVPNSTELQVRIHADTITGPTLSSSRIVQVLPDQGGPVLFAFDSSVPLNPGQRYVMELVDVGPWYWLLAGEIENHYPSGRGILGGTPSDGIDFWFREGMYVTTPVGSSSWGKLKFLFR